VGFFVFASYPARHTQVLTLFRAWPSCAVLAGHAWHVEALVAASSVEKVLLPHSVHATLPLAGLKRPAAHGTQRHGVVGTRRADLQRFVRVRRARHARRCRRSHLPARVHARKPRRTPHAVVTPDVKDVY